MARKGYDAAFRAKAVQLAEEIGYPRATSILGIPSRTIHAWKKLLLSGESMNSPEMNKKLSPELKAALVDADEAKKELKRLKKENEELKTANLILRELAAVFSKDPLN